MNTLNILIIVICFVVGFHYMWKIVDRFCQIKRYKDSKAHFLSDLYRIENKWAKRGCYDYSEAVSMIIKAFNLAPEKPTPVTAEGKRVLKNLEELEEEEING